VHDPLGIRHRPVRNVRPVAVGRTWRRRRGGHQAARGVDEEWRLHVRPV